MSVDLPAEERPIQQRHPETALPHRTGMLADPMVRVMLFVTLGLVILYLATVIGVLSTGVATHESPRTRAEKELVLASGAVTLQMKGEDLAPYVDAQIAAGDWAGARATLMQARASAPKTTPLPALDLAEARMAMAKDDAKGAIVWADKAMKGYRAEYEARLEEAKAKDTESPPVRLPSDYYNAALLKAYGFQEVGRWKDAIAMFDIYLKASRTASDIYVERGYAKIEVGDKAGAKKDFQRALKYVPYDERAQAGLKKIGVAK